MPKQPPKPPGHSAPVTDAALAARLQQGLRSHQSGQLNEAETVYRALLASAPSHFDALQLLATLHAQRGQAADAVRLFNKALAVNPGSANVLNNLSAVLVGLGRFEEAEEALGRSATAAPNSPGVWNNLGVVRTKLGRPAEAIDAFVRAIALKPDFADALANRAAALCAVHRYAEAAESCSAALTIAPNHAAALANRGLAYRHLDRLQDALNSLDAALIGSPGDADAWQTRGDVLHALGRLDEAVASFRRAIAIRPKFADALAACAVTLFQMERYDEALAPISEAVRLNSKSIAWQTVLGDVRLELQRYDKAVEAYDNAEALKPTPGWRETLKIEAGGGAHMVVVAEPGFATSAGHYQRGVEGLARLVSRPIVCCAHMSVDKRAVGGNVVLEPFFPVSINAQAIPAFVHQGRYLDAPLVRLLNAMRPEDHLVVPSGDIAMVNALTRVLRRRPPERMPQVHLRFFMVDQGIMPAEAGSAAIRRLMDTTGARARIHVMMELPEQVDYARDAWGVEAECIPYIQPALFSPEPVRRDETSLDKLAFGFFGAGRGEKGLEFIPLIMDAFLANAPDLVGKVRWIVQSSGESERAKAAAAPLRAYADAHPGMIDLHTDTLTSKAYDALFAQADIIALPYKADLYRMRSSGVAAEATFAAKPFVYSRTSSLGAYAGASALDADTPETFAAALADICRNYREFAACARDARQALRDRIFKSEFLKRISAPAD